MVQLEPAPEEAPCAASDLAVARLDQPIVVAVKVDTTSRGTDRCLWLPSRRSAARSPRPQRFLMRPWSTATPDASLVMCLDPPRIDLQSVNALAAGPGSCAGDFDLLES